MRLRIVAALLSLAVGGVLNAQVEQALRVEALTPLLQTEPGQAATLVIRVANPSSLRWEGDAVLDLPPGWSLVIAPPALQLDPGTSETLLFTVIASASARAGRHEVRLRLHNPEGELQGESVATLDLSNLIKIDLSPLELPGYVLAEPYTATFIVRNGGNRSVELAFTATDSHGFTIELSPARLRLAPRETAEILASVSVPAGLERWSVHSLTLSASYEDDEAQQVSRTVKVELIPRQPVRRHARHSFPLTLRLASGFDNASGPLAAQSLEGSELFIRGSGKLWDKDPGVFSVSFKNSLDLSIRQNALSYKRDAFTLGFGDQGFTPSSLLPGLKGFGLYGRIDDRLTPEVEAGARGFVADLGEELGYGVHLSSRWYSLLELNGTLLVTGADAPPALGARLVLSPELAQLSKLKVAVEVARQAAASGLSAGAFTAEGEVARGDSSFRVAWRQTEAGFRDAQDDRYSLDAVVRLRLVEPDREAETPQRPGWLSEPREASRTETVSVWFKRERSYPAGALLVGEALTRSDQFGARATGRWYRAQWWLDYQLSEKRDDGVDSSQQTDTWSVGLDLPLGEEVSWQQGLLWQQSRNAASAALLSSSSHLSYVLSSGRVSPSLTLEWNLADTRFKTLAAGLAWSDGGAAGLSARIDATYKPFSADRLNLSTTAAYRLENQQALEFVGSGQVKEDGSATARFKASYSLPVSLPLGRLSTVGNVSGVLINDRGAPVEGILLRLAGTTAVSQADGRFFFFAVPEGEQVLTIVPSAQSFGLVSEPATPYRLVVDSSKEQQLSLTLSETARVEGRLVLTRPRAEAEGDRALHFVEEALNAGALQGWLVELRRDGEARRTFTDEGGTFVFTDLSEGEWQLEVSAPPGVGGFSIAQPRQSLYLLAGQVSRPVIDVSPRRRTLVVIEGGEVESVPLAPDNGPE